MRFDCFWLDGECSLDYGIVLQNPMEFKAAEPKLSTLTIPGRSGDLHIYEGGYENITGTASCYLLQHHVEDWIDRVAWWLFSKNGYRRLETSDDPAHYRMACVSNAPEISIRMHLLAPFDIKFDCMPQRFRRDGEQTIRFDTSGGSLYNQGFPSLPKITVYGNSTSAASSEESAEAGKLQIGNYNVTIKSIDGSVVLDSDTQNAYKDTANKNSTIATDAFPIMEHGENQVTWTGSGITAVEIEPRWWTL